MILNKIIKTKMKKLILLAVVLYSAVSCTNVPTNKVAGTTAQTVATGTGQKLEVDAQASSIYWKGTKVGGMHDGTIGIKEGSLTLSPELQVTSGAFVIDMNDMVSLDLKDDAKLQPMLIGHLKSADFFDVEAYPTSTFTITQIVEATPNDSVTHFISGNLKMKDVEKNITFGANISAEVVKNDTDEEETIYKAETIPFTIDRTEWNVKFGSKKLFPDLRDMLVDDNIQLKISIVAKATPLIN